MIQYCKYCNATIKQTAKYCGGCGKAVEQKNHGIESRSVQLVIAFYITFLLYAIATFIIYRDGIISLKNEIIVEIVFVALTLIFCSFDAKKILGLYNLKHISWQSLAFAIVFPVITAAIVYVGIEGLNSLLFDETDNIFYDYAGYENPLFWALLFTVVLPPIFEELAFRGVFVQQIKKFCQSLGNHYSYCIYFCTCSFFLSFYFMDIPVWFGFGLFKISFQNALARNDSAFYTQFIDFDD